MERFTKLFCDRPNPEFSRIAAALSFEENDLLRSFLKLWPDGTVQNVVLMHDGAYADVSDFRRECRLRYVIRRKQDKFSKTALSWSTRLQGSRRSRLRWMPCGHG